MFLFSCTWCASLILFLYSHRTSCEIMHTITMDIVFGGFATLLCSRPSVQVQPPIREAIRQIKSPLYGICDTMISQEIFLTSWYWVSNASRDPFVLLLSRVQSQSQSQSNATSKSKLVIERQRAKNKATQLHSVVLDSILRFDTPIQYSDSILRVGGGCMSIVRSAITICSTIRRYLHVFIAWLFCDG